MARLLRWLRRGVEPTGFIFMGFTKVFKADFTSIKPPDLHHISNGGKVEVLQVRKAWLRQVKGYKPRKTQPAWEARVPGTRPLSTPPRKSGEIVVITGSAKNSNKNMVGRRSLTTDLKL